MCADQTNPRCDTVYVAIARAFIRQNLYPLAGSRISAADLLARRGEWCECQRLFRPPAEAVAYAMRLEGYTSLKTRGRHVWCGAQWRGEIDPFIAISEPDVLRRLGSANPVIPLRTFMRLVRLPRSTFYKQRSMGRAPPCRRLGSRVFITAEDAVKWCVATARHGPMLAVFDWIEDRRSSVDATSRRAMERIWTGAR
jgi:hypothetical protein